MRGFDILKLELSQLKYTFSPPAKVISEGELLQIILQ